ncbi:VWD domain-containing protein [Yinghuangia sp. YIM S10712]|uniref:VWD domain-containing protein n=1 Tax=Yinghuangia sp. YIM S10712 TaxID=3436930 RepID=UPI003F531BD7
MARSGTHVHAGVRTALLAVVLLLPLGACSLIKEKLEELKKPAPTAWDNVMDMSGPHGEVTKEMALAAFATAYGPLPDVAPVSGSRAGLRSGSAALRWVSDRWSEITPEQRAAVSRAIGRDRLPGRPEPDEPDDRDEPDAPESTVPAGGAGKSVRYGPMAGPDDLTCPPGKPHNAALEQELLRWWSGIGPNVGLTSTPRISACVSAVPSTQDNSTDENGDDSGVAAADAWGSVSPSGLQCQVTTYPSLRRETARVRDEVLVHELGHCAQMLVAESAHGYGRIPAWVAEGWSNWLSGKVTGHFDQPESWSNYLTRAKHALNRQSYEAVGFWWEAEYRGIDVWQAIRRTVVDAASANDAQRHEVAFRAALGGQSTEFLEGWASSFLREGIRNAAWETAGVGITQDSYLPANTHTIANDKRPYPARSGPFDPGLTQLDLVADIVKLESGSPNPVFGRFGPGITGDFPLSAGIGMPFCTLGYAKCVCPPDTPGYGTKFQVIDPGPAFLASTGGERDTVVNVTGQSIDDFCGPPKPQPVPPATTHTPKCKGACTASSNGDPHMTTFDGVFYDLMSVGEFTLVDATDDTMLVQTRQVPLEGFADVSVNSAVAADVAGDRVGFHLKPDGVEVHLNGADVTPSAGETRLPKGGTLARTGDGPAASYSLTWPDGSQLFATPIASYGLKVDMALSPTRQGQLTGLLGNFDGDRTNDLDAGDGRLLPPAAPHADIHGAFADHWRVTQEASLFDYEPGQSTATFTDRTFPKGPVHIPAEARSQAEKACRAAGVTDPQLLESCILDVALTGRSEFAASVAAQQKFRDIAAGSQAGDVPVPAACVQGGDGQNTRLIDIKVGDTVSLGGFPRDECAGYLPTGDWAHQLGFTGEAGRTVHLRKAGDTDCSLRWSLWKWSVDVYGNTGNVLPAVSVCQDLGTVTLPEAATYIVLIDKQDQAASGRYGFSLTE